eukprot:scaffold100712_cov31-Tisochrysis_lutea.AAC.1
MGVAIPCSPITYNSPRAMSINKMESSTGANMPWQIDPSHVSHLPAMQRLSPMVGRQGGVGRARRQ